MRILFVRKGESNSTFSYHHYLVQLLKEAFAVEILYFDKNSTPIQKDNFLLITDIPKPSLLGYQRWYDVQLPKLIKDWRIDKVIYLNGYCPALQGVKQIQVIDNIDFLNNNPKEKDKWKQFCNGKVLQSFSAADKIVIYSEKAKEEVAQSYSQASEKMIVVPSVSKENITPLDWTQQSEIKEQLAEGCEYFVSLIEQKTTEAIIHLLKAFSQFKKWQKSSMKLLILCNAGLKDNEELNEKINSYKYKADVQLLFEINNEKLMQSLSAAYGFIYFPIEESAILPMSMAMQSESPVITNVHLFDEKASEESAFFLKDDSIDTLGHAMIGLYKAESLRSILIKQGREWVTHFSYKEALEKIKQILN